MKVKRFGEILTKRPEGMKYEVYRMERRSQQQMLKGRVRKGFLVWPSRDVGTLRGKVPALEFN